MYVNFQAKTDIPFPHSWEDEGCKARMRMLYFTRVGASASVEGDGSAPFDDTRIKDGDDELLPL